MLTMLVELFNFFIESVIFCGEVGVFIGYGIVCFITAICVWTVFILAITFSIIQVLLEDFGAFLREALDIGEGITSEVFDAVDGISDTYFVKVKNVFNGIFSLVKKAVEKQVSFFLALVDFGRLILKLLVDGLTLIGSLALSLINLFITFVYNLVTAPITSFLYICDSTYNGLLVLIETFMNLPMESAIGLLVVLSCCVLYRKYNGNEKLKQLLYLMFIGSINAAQIFLTVCILTRWTIARFVKRFKFSSLSFRKKKIHLREESPSKVELMKKLEQEISLRMCVICMANPRDVIVMNCQHFCMCNSCAKQIRNMSNECPVCRKHIYRISYVYM